MSDMRLIVAGAGGRMGRTLIRAIAETEGVTLTGALEAPSSELLGEDSGVLAGLPPNGVMLSGDLWSLSKDADGIVDRSVVDPIAVHRLTDSEMIPMCRVDNVLGLQCRIAPFHSCDHVL